MPHGSVVRFLSHAFKLLILTSQKILSFRERRPPAAIAEEGDGCRWSRPLPVPSVRETSPQLTSLQKTEPPGASAPDFVPGERSGR